MSKVGAFLRRIQMEMADARDIFRPVSSDERSAKDGCISSVLYRPLCDKLHRVLLVVLGAAAAMGWTHQEIHHTWILGQLRSDLHHRCDARVDVIPHAFTHHSVVYHTIHVEGLAKWNGAIV